MQLIHKPTGIVVKSQATRSRSQNQKIAHEILAAKVEELEKGGGSREAIKTALKRKRKASSMKKKRRKYRALDDTKETQQGGDDDEGSVQEDVLDEGEDLEKDEDIVDRQSDQRA